MESRNLEDLRVVDLKKELELRGLAKSGSKKELVDRLRNYIETEEHHGDTEEQAPSLELQDDGQNEFVKSYLQQRQKLLSQQMEQKKRYEEETSRSQSECEADDRVASPERHGQLAAPKSAAVVVVENEDSGDSTDIEMQPEAGDQPVSEAAEQLPQSEVCNIGDGHKPSEVSDSTYSDTNKVLSLSGASPQHHSGCAQMDEDSELMSNQRPTTESKSLTGDVAAEAADVGMPESEERGSRSPEDQRSRSSSVSTSPGQQRSCSRSRSRSRSHSAHSSRSGSRSPSHGQDNSRSRSSSVDEQQEVSDDRKMEDRHRSRSSSGNGVRSRSSSSSAEGRQSDQERSRSRSPSADKSAAASAAIPNQPVNEDDGIQSETVPLEFIPPVDLVMEESQQSIDSRIETDKVTVEMKDEPPSATVVGSEKMVPVVNIPVSKSVIEVAPAATFSASKPVRKRKWGTTAVPESKTIVISTDSLKGLGLAISAEAIAAEVPMELEQVSTNGVESSSGRTSPVPRRTVLAKSESDTRATKIRRIVYKEESVAKDENEGAQKMSASKAEEELQKDVKPDDMSSVVIPEQTADAEPTTGTAPSGEPAKVSRSVSLKVSDEAKVVRSVSLTVEDPVDAGRRAPSPPRRPPSNIIHVTGLVRPYTLGQLKELLGRTGTLVPDGFWIDSIKSHCYVTYETVEQAVATREALHGKRWPASNPKFLGIEFRTAEELEFRKSNNAAPRPAAKLASEQPQPAASKEPEKSRIGREAHPDASKDPARVSRDSAKPRQSPKGTKEKAASPSQQPLREWDRHKLKQPSRSKSRERRPKEDMAKRERDRKEVDRRRDQRDRQKEDRRPRDRTDKPAVAGAAKVEEEPPAKLLDDLFRKTKAAPSIYWLPLTDEQVAEKMAQEKERAATKERMRIEREQQMEVERQQRQKAREERERAREAEHGGRLSHRKFSEEGPSRRKSRSRADRN